MGRKDPVQGICSRTICCSFPLTAFTRLQKADLIILPPSFLDTFERANVAMLPPLVTLLDKQRMDENLMTTVLLEQKKVVDNKQKKDGLSQQRASFDLVLTSPSHS